MIKIKVVVIPVVLVMAVYAQVIGQSSTSSPFSHYGYGLLDDKSLSFSQALAGTGIGLRSTKHLDFINPASLSALDSTNFIFEVGVQSQFSKLMSPTQTTTVGNTNMQYLAFGFHVAKWWGAGVGMMPFSRVGYQDKERVMTPDSVDVETDYLGRGGITQIVWGNSFEIFKSLSIGFNACYLFGETNINSANIIYSDRYADYTLKQTWNYIHAVIFEAGAQYKYNISRNKSVIFGVLYVPAQKIHSSKDELVGTTATSTSDAASDTVSYSANVKNTYPQKIGGGVSYTIVDKLQMGVDYTYQNWSKAVIYENPIGSFNKASSLNFGLEYTPDKYSSQTYFKRMQYRFGGRLSNTYLNVSDNATNVQYQLTETAVSLGFGLPLRQTASNINISCEAGTRKTTDKTILREQFLSLNINFTLNENWFYKRKIN